MSGRIIKNVKDGTQQIIHFSRRLVEKQYKVLPPPIVPSHIIKPQYAISKKPVFAQYEGTPQILNNQQIEKIKKSAEIASSTLRQAEKWLIQKSQQDIDNNTDGTITTQDLDRFVFDTIIKAGAYPTPIGFMGFPKSVCISMNQCVVHGIGNMRPIYLGDKINMDVTVYYDGFHGDTNLSLIYGAGKQKISTPEVSNIVKLTQKALYEAISICEPGVPFNKVGLTLQNFAKRNGIHICEHFTGHGVGQLLHMPPMVYHVYYPFEKAKMQINNVFTIEPVMTHYQSSSGLKQWDDNFTVISQNNPNAQFQHMIRIVEGGCEVITQREGENIPNPNNNIKNLKV